MGSLYVPAGPEVAPSLQTPQPVASPTSTPQSNSSSTSISTTSTISIALFLSLFTLAALAAAVYWIRKRRTTLEASDESKASDEQRSGKEAVHDVEAMAASRPIVPVVPPPGVRWTPQIRSISGPAQDERMRRKSASLLPKRPRSPPPRNLGKTRNLFPDLHPKSAPAHALSFSQHDVPHPLKSLSGDPSPPVTPLALAVSGMETRTLGKPGFGSKN